MLKGQSKEGFGEGALYPEWKSKQASKVAQRRKPRDLHSIDRTIERWKERINTTKLSSEAPTCSVALMPCVHNNNNSNNNNKEKSGATKVMQQTEPKQFFKRHTVTYTFHKVLYVFKSIAGYS